MACTSWDGVAAVQPLRGQHRTLTNQMALAANRLACSSRQLIRPWPTQAGLPMQLGPHMKRQRHPTPGLSKTMIRTVNESGSIVL